jgi:predicted negative regulator of RcsB-dependent stress response
VEDLSEKEQLDALRAWWAENGSYVMGGIFVGVIIIFGWNRWQTGIADTEAAASALFEEMMAAAAQGNIDSAGETADSLLGGYAETPYAAQARLTMARLYMDNGRDQDAADVLRALAEGNQNNELSLVARLRLAKILLYQGKGQEVVDLLRDMPDTGFAARFNEALGDAYVSLEMWAEAEAAYIAALNDNPQIPTVDDALIQLKLNDLPIINDAESSETALPDSASSSADEAPVIEPADREPAEAGDSEPQEE